MPRWRKPGVHGSRRSRQSGAPATRLAASPWRRTPHGGPVAYTRSIGADRISRRTNSAVRGVRARRAGGEVCAWARSQRRTRPPSLGNERLGDGAVGRPVASMRPPPRRVVAHDFDRRRQPQRRRIGRVPGGHGAGEDDRLPAVVGQMQREAIGALAADVVERREVARDDQDPAQPPVSSCARGDDVHAQVRPALMLHERGDYMQTTGMGTIARVDLDRLVEIARAPVRFDAEQPGARLPPSSPVPRRRPRPTPRAGGRNSFRRSAGLQARTVREARRSAMRRSPRSATRARVKGTADSTWEALAGRRRQFRGGSW